MILATGKTGARPAGETGDVWRCVDLGDEAFGVFEFMQIQGGHLVRATAIVAADRTRPGRGRVQGTHPLLP